MKALFLDIDGCLNGAKAVTLLSISKPMLKRLKRVISETGCVLVLSSTWRNSAAGMQKLRRVGLKFYGITPNLAGTDRYTGELRTRGNEIEKYLIDHPEITCYAIVDDIDDMLDHQKPYFVKTDERFGLTSALADDLIRILNKGDGYVEMERHN